MVDHVFKTSAGNQNDKRSNLIFLEEALDVLFFFYKK